MKALHLGMQSILLGEAEVVIAGGQENMSLGPHMIGVFVPIKGERGWRNSLFLTATC